MGFSRQGYAMPQNDRVWGSCAMTVRMFVILRECNDRKNLMG